MHPARRPLQPSLDHALGGLGSRPGLPWQGSLEATHRARAGSEGLYTAPGSSLPPAVSGLGSHYVNSPGPGFLGRFPPLFRASLPPRPAGTGPAPPGPAAQAPDAPGPARLPRPGDPVVQAAPPA